SESPRSRCFYPLSLHDALPISLVTWGGWHTGAWVESWFFTVTDPATGLQIADFRLWWQEFSGAPFEQRNSMVVGFMMGFAVIPIDRKSTRLNSSHVKISYAVFC